MYTRSGSHSGGPCVSSWVAEAAQVEMADSLQGCGVPVSLPQALQLRKCFDVSALVRCLVSGGDGVYKSGPHLFYYMSESQCMRFCSPFCYFDIDY